MQYVIRIEKPPDSNRTPTEPAINNITSDFTHEIALEIGVMVRQGNHSTLSNPDFHQID
jgi:hypothetical protein